MKAVHEPEHEPGGRTVARTHPTVVDGGAGARRPSMVTGSDPRLAHAAGAPATLMHLQRTAGNAAVAALVGGEPPVQREVGVDEVASEVGGGAASAGTTPTGGAPTPAAAGAVTSDGANTTITGAHITLNAAMTEASGVLRADTIIADSVVASSYTPGAGNVW